MSKEKRFVSVLFMFLLAVLFCIPFAQAGEDVIGKTFYTAANIWYEKPERILSTNYHKGALIPVGTKVTIEELRHWEIHFADENGLRFNIILVEKHSSREMTIEKLFEQYFSEENPLREGGPFQKFSKDEKKNIKAGEIEVGMSKAAVLMAYGYPPSHRTPSLKSDMWTYWVNMFVERKVIFTDDKVVKIGR